jgi:hypothetical protein
MKELFFSHAPVPAIETFFPLSVVLQCLVIKYKAFDIPTGHNKTIRQDINFHCTLLRATHTLLSRVEID